MTADETKVILDLIGEAYRLRRHDARAMLATASMAFDLCLARAGSAPELQDLRGLCSAHVGNAQRILGRLRDAGQTFAQAFSFLDLGTGDPAYPAIALRFRASLEESKGQYREALMTLREAAKLYVLASDLEGIAACRVKAAIVLAYAGESEAAFNEVVSTLPVIQDEELLRSAWTVAIRALCDAGRADAGLNLVALGRPLLLRGGLLFRLKIDWLEAQLRHDCGLDASSSFGALRETYLSLNMGFQASLLAVEQSLCELRFGRPAKASALLQLAAPILLDAELVPELLASQILSSEAQQEAEAVLCAAVRQVRLRVWRAT